MLNKHTDHRTVLVWPRDVWSRDLAGVLMRYEGVYVTAIGVEWRRGGP